MNELQSIQVPCLLAAGRFVLPLKPGWVQGLARGNNKAGTGTKPLERTPARQAQKATLSCSWAFAARTSQVTCRHHPAAQRVFRQGGCFQAAAL